MLRGLLENRSHCLIAATLHRVPCALGLPASDREQAIGIANLAVQARTAGPRRLLQNLTHSDPCGCVLLRRMRGLDANLEDKFHMTNSCDGVSAPEGTTRQIHTEALS